MRRIHLLALALPAAVLAAQAAPAYHAHMMGAQLVHDMLADPFVGANSVHRERAMGYIEGVADAAVGARWCPAGRAVPHELTYVVVEEMQKAGQADGDASAQVLAALGRLYPCRAGGAR